MQMVIIETAMNYFCGKQTGYAPEAKKIKLMKSSVKIDFMNTKIAYNREETTSWKAQALVAWSVCDARFFIGEDGWELFISKMTNDPILCKRICKMLDYRQISTQLLYKAYVHGKNPRAYGFLLIKASRKQNHWNCVHRLYTVRPHFARDAPEFHDAAIKAGFVPP
jgi:trans-2-enoyl-CoA reductase